nr:MAG TPA: hypothetical protein [Caudoviricetes sp.]
MVCNLILIYFFGSVGVTAYGSIFVFSIRRIRN